MRFERGLVVQAALDIMAIVGLHFGDFLGAEFAHDLADAADQRVVGDDASFRDDGAGADQGNRGRPRRCSGRWPACPNAPSWMVQPCSMAWWPTVTLGPTVMGQPASTMQHAGFLDVGAAAHQDGRIVAADGDLRPDAHAGLQGDVADDIGAVGDRRWGRWRGSGRRAGKSALRRSSGERRWRVRPRGGAGTARWIFPVVVMGKASTYSISLGYS